MKKMIIATTLALLTGSVYAQEKIVPLYPDGIPNSKATSANYVEKDSGGWITGVTQPTLTIFYPEKGHQSKTAVIVCPGGAYAGLSGIAEGADVCREFAKIGVTAFLLKYRLPSEQIMTDRSIGPLQDAQTAILIVRRNAANWNIDPAKIGIIGFSAGGHLASTAGTHFSRPVIKNISNISLRPDFMMLIYPVISFGEYTHGGSKENLVGKTPAADQVVLYSNELQITAETPPTFLVHSQDDTAVPVQNSLMFYEGLLKNKIKAEMHLFEEGGHGFGLNNPKSKNKWFEWAASWLTENGFNAQQ